MSRLFFNLAAAISLIVFVASAAAWVASTSGIVGVRREHVRTLRSGGAGEFMDDHAFAGVIAIGGRVDVGASGHDPSSDAWAGSSEGRYEESVNWHRTWVRTPRAPSWSYFDSESVAGGGVGTRLGVTWRSNPQRGMWGALVPLSYVTLAASILPALWVVRWRARRRRQRRLEQGQCAACGYDLRGSAGDRCPECGVARPTVA